MATATKSKDTSEKETFDLTLKFVGNLRQSQFNNRWQRFVVATTADGAEYVFNAEGNASRTIGEMAKGSTVSVTAYRGKTVDREWNGQTTQQTRLNRVYLAGTDTSN